MKALKTKAILPVLCPLILGIAPPARAGLFETKLTASDAALGDQFGESVFVHAADLD